MKTHTELSLPLETLLRLRERGPAALEALRTLAARGDWKTRTLALSAAGRIVREDPSSTRLRPFRHLVARRIPWLRRRFPSAGPQGAFIRGSLCNGLSDRVWIVRMAAALALGECRSPEMAEALSARLLDTHRPVRVAAAAALLACGRTPPGIADALLEGAEGAPERVGDTDTSLEWLARLAALHAVVLSAWRRVPGATAPARDDPQEWARELAGTLKEESRESRAAEVRRYAQEKETHYNFTKPFTSVNRTQNVRLLHSFLVVAENLRVPQRGLVLDLGGGAAWVSELLAKLGYRPITLDLAPALLRVGRDRFTREHLPARLLAGDMTALPLRSESVEAVVVIDALHHVPDVPAVFREAFRVLVRGGQFVIAEPGEGHAETEKSRAEMDEHGVCEREVHLFEAARYGREAGFDEARVIPHYVPSLAMSPADLSAAMRTPSDRWRVSDNGRPAAFDEYVLQSVLAHPILVFGKGERPLDSRMPRELRADIEPDLFREGARLHGAVHLRNLGDTLWLRGGDEAGRVRLGLQLMSPERKLLNLDWARAELPADVPPAGTLTVAVDVALPEPEAPYVVKLDLVDEHVCWFEDLGSRPVYVAV